MFLSVDSGDFQERVYNSFSSWSEEALGQHGKAVTILSLKRTVKLIWIFHVVLLRFAAAPVHSRTLLLSVSLIWGKPANIYCR